MVQTTEDQYSRRGGKIDSKWKINLLRIRLQRQEKRRENTPNLQETTQQGESEGVWGWGEWSTADVMIKTDCMRVNRNLLPWQRKGAVQAFGNLSCHVTSVRIFSSLV